MQEFQELKKRKKKKKKLHFKQLKVSFCVQVSEATNNTACTQAFLVMFSNH